MFPHGLIFSNTGSECNWEWTSPWQQRLTSSGVSRRINILFVFRWLNLSLFPVFCTIFYSIDLISLFPLFRTFVAEFCFLESLCFYCRSDAISEEQRGETDASHPQGSFYFKYLLAGFQSSCIYKDKKGEKSPPSKKNNNNKQKLFFYFSNDLLLSVKCNSFFFVYLKM